MEVPIDKVVRVYSGRPGCGCGCRGTYWDDTRNIRRVTGIMNARAAEVQETDGVFFIEDDKRYYWAYTK